VVVEEKEEDEEAGRGYNNIATIITVIVSNPN